jgi:hypothetical protein
VVDAKAARRADKTATDKFDGFEPSNQEFHSRINCNQVGAVLNF